MMVTRRNLRRTVLLALLSTCVLAAPAAATGPMHGPQRFGGQVVGVRPLPPLNGPAGPTPLNPAGPTPLNPAGGPPIGIGRSSFSRRGYPVQQPGVSVGFVGGGGNGGFPVGGSFFCQVHNRGYASQSLFFDHLARVDGMQGDDAMSYLIEDGGVWVFPAE